MKKFILTSLLAPISLSSSLALAGAWSSGGGNTVVCTDAANQILSVELLDLYEGRILHQKNFINPAAPSSAVDLAAQNARKIYSPIFDSQSLILRIQQINSQIQFLPSGVGLQPTHDSNTVVLPPSGCSILQVARYEPNNTIYVRSDLWNKMDVLNQAALLVHEGLYWQLRFTGDQTSERARLTVATAFSNESLIPYDSGIPNNSEYCETKPDSDGLSLYSFFSFPAKNGVTVQFVNFNGNPMLSKSTLNLTAATWPLATNSGDQFWSAIMNSQVDMGIGIYFQIDRKRSATSTGFVGPADGVKLPNNSFTCRLMAETP